MIALVLYFMSINIYILLRENYQYIEDRYQAASGLAPLPFEYETYRHDFLSPFESTEIFSFDRVLHAFDFSVDYDIIIDGDSKFEDVISDYVSEGISIFYLYFLSYFTAKLNFIYISVLFFYDFFFSITREDFEKSPLFPSKDFEQNVIFFFNDYIKSNYFGEYVLLEGDCSEDFPQPHDDNSDTHPEDNEGDFSSLDFWEPTIHMIEERPGNDLLKYLFYYSSGDLLHFWAIFFCHLKVIGIPF
jgi:hypothetical protein